MGAVFQLCHFKSKKTQTAPNCLLPRELSTPQKPSSGQQCSQLVRQLRKRNDELRDQVGGVWIPWADDDLLTRNRKRR